MPSFPLIHSGTIAAKYPSSRTNRRRVAVHVFCNFAEQRYRKGARIAEFQLTFRRVNNADRLTLRTFYIERQGETDVTWDLAFDSLSYHNCRFIGPLDVTQVGSDQFDMTFRIQGFPV